MKVGSKKQNTKVDDHARDRVRTWIDIDTKAIAHNYRQFRKLIGKKVNMLGLVKSNAYGHNLVEFSHQLEHLGIDYLGVDSIVEAIRLRKEKIKTPIIVLGFTLPTFYKEAIQHDIILTLSGFESLDAMMKIKETKGKNNMLRVHVKVDTGMHRQGFQWGEHELLLKRLNSPEAKSRLRVEGLYTHFADAKSPRDREYTFKQIKEFENWKNQFALHGLTVISHASATSGTLIYPEDRYDMVRIGIGLYGSWPADEIQKYLEDTFTLKPVLSWKTVVAEVKQVKRGERIGYNLTELLTRDSKIAVLPIGYWHGFRRSMSSKGRVLIHSKTARVLGRVSMDMIVVDVTDIFSVKMGDVAVIIGKSGKEEITAGELARFMGTTDYEVLTTINPLIKKFYI